MNNQLSIYNLLPKNNNNHLSANETYIGIDFGTSTTVVSICSIDENKRIKITPISFKQHLADGRLYNHYLLPSVIALSNNQLLIGKGAYDLKYQLTEGVNLWHSFKMELGIDLGPKYFRSQLYAGHPLGTIESPRDAVKVFFNFIKQGIDAVIEEEGLSPNTRYAVSIPAGFEANQRRELLDILQEVGLPKDRHAFIDEPNAAFINYLVEYNHNNFKHYQIPNDSPLNIMVFDFGAGTCDISIIALKNNGSALTTENLSISSFLPLGGNDIDKAIARQILLSQLLIKNKINEEDLKRQDIDKRILPRLQGIAEKLKINLCKNISTQMINNRLSGQISSEQGVKVTENSTISLPKRKLQLGDFYLSCADFVCIMDPFLDSLSLYDYCSEEGNTVSIFSPINSALNKAELEIDDIDLLLMIGGSAQNPYVIDALKNQYPELEIEIPQNLQTHVSCGTSVYSKLIHGMNFDIIQPITSEPLLYMTKEGIKVLVPANAPIPSQPVLLESLRVVNDKQKVIEIPIFISTDDKLLHIIRITEKEGKGFSANTIVQLNIQITENKLIEIEVKIDGQIIPIEYLNPFANYKLSSKEQVIFDKLKKANISARNNDGRPAIKSLNDLYEAYADAGQHLKAAELLENIQKLQPSKDLSTSICYHYSHTGKNKQTLYWAEQAYKKNETATTIYNLALRFRHSDEDRFCQLMEKGLKINSDAEFILCTYGSYLMNKDHARGKKLLERALTLLSSDLNSGFISDNDLNRLIECARHLNASDVLRKAREKRDSEKSEKEYDDKNLLQSSHEKLERRKIYELDDNKRKTRRNTA